MREAAEILLWLALLAFCFLMLWGTGYLLLGVLEWLDRHPLGRLIRRIRGE